MNKDAYMEVVVQIVMFLELSDSETVAEDAAIEMMERIAAILQKLGCAEKSQLAEYIKSRTAQVTNNSERQCLQNMVSNLGLLPE